MTFLRKKRFAIIASLLLTGFTVYTLLDTFVIPHSYAAVSDSVRTSSGSEEDPDAASSASVNEKSETNETVKTASAAGGKRSRKKQKSEETSASAESAGSGVTAESTDDTATPGNRVSPQDSYSDGGVTVTLTETRVQDTTVYVADIQLSSSDSLKTAFAENTYGRNVKDATSVIAAENDAVLAINGDFYGARNAGYVIRNGVLYRDKGNGGEDLVIWADGSFSIIQEDEVSAQELLDAGAVQVFSFGPALIEEGQISISESEEVGKAMASNPRTAIGIIEKGHYVMVVSDGRTDESEGLSLHELAEFMQTLGVRTAYNLDGGGSSTMVFNGTVINNPTTSGNSTKERSVSDIVYIAK